jgi:hypothetical protein
VTVNTRNGVPSELGEYRLAASARLA